MDPVFPGLWWRKQPPGWSLTARAYRSCLGQKKMKKMEKSKENQNYLPHYNYVMFIISNGDSELGSCKGGWLPKMESSRVLSCRELIKEKRATLGIICSHLKVIIDILYCHGKDWRHNVKWKKKQGMNIGWNWYAYGHKLKQILEKI